MLEKLKSIKLPTTQFDSPKSELEKWTRLTPTNSLYDRGLIWLFVGLLTIGFVAVTSASIPLSAEDPFGYAIKDGVYILVAITVFSLFSNISMEKWQKYSTPLMLLSLALLVVVLFIGTKVNGSTRWIRLAGAINFQPAELAKLAVICYFADFYTRKYDEIRVETFSLWRPGCILGLFVLFLYMQPDLGSIIVLFVLTFSLLFIAGARLKQFVLLAVGASLLLYGAAQSEYRMRRIMSYRDPFADVFGDGYQLSNSFMAFGQGEIWGRGLGNSVQKQNYLPEAHTDFIMAVIGEEFGLIGIVFIVVLLATLTWKALQISKISLKLEKRFHGYLAFGISILIFFQGFVNLGMASGLIPTKGLTFPLVSYGGSSLIIMSIIMAILVRIDHENRLERIGHAHLKDN
ncbi:putative lipid II flippase FtsW [Pasteurellaceae bacterium 15-036681]|nr:putative lipid II flippase FtsW [Pasteurellaceae bacterium 15-036681]